MTEFLLPSFWIFLIFSTLSARDLLYIFFTFFLMSFSEGNTFFLMSGTVQFLTLNVYFVKVIVHLVRNLDIVKEPAARALIIWIIGEYSSVGQLIQKIVPTVLKYLAWSFTSEELETKLQILNSTWKVFLLSGRLFYS